MLHMLDQLMVSQRLVNSNGKILKKFEYNLGRVAVNCTKFQSFKQKIEILKTV